MASAVENPCARSLLELPPQVLPLILSQLAVADAVFLSHTCCMLRKVVLELPARCTTTNGQQHATTLGHVIAAAGQRVAAVTGGRWRDALLLGAWHNQQRASAAGAAHNTQQQQQATPSPVLQRMLLSAAATQRPMEVALIAGGLGQLLATDATHRAHTAPAAPPSRLTCAQYWAPGEAQLLPASCLVTDGRSTALLELTQPAAAAAAAAVGDGPCSAGASTGCCHPTCSPLGLLHGHLPPADRQARDVPLHHLLLLPTHPAAGTQTSSSSASSGSARLSADSATARLTTMLGLRHVLHYLHMWWRLHTTTSTTRSTSGGDTQQQQPQQDSSPQAQQQKQQQEGVSYKGPRQVLLLPLLPPPGSVSGLQQPWPPATAPGSSYQHLGCADVSAGLRGCPRLVRDALVMNEPALLMPAGLCGSTLLPAGMERIEGPPHPSWWGALRHLDLSGQAGLTDAVLAQSLLKCSSSLATLNLADTAAGCMVFAALGQQRQGQQQQQQQSREQQHAEAAAQHSGSSSSSPGEAALSAALAGLRLRAGMMGAGRGASAAAAAAAAARAIASQQLQAAAAAAAGVGPTSSAVVKSGPGWCCQLRVLDVSGCAALTASTAVAAAGASDVFRLFKAAVGAMQQLEVLLACRLNVDAAFSCSCNCFAHEATTTSTSCSFCCVLSRLVELDVSAATQLSVATLAGLLRACCSLRRLGAAGCKTLAATPADDAAAGGSGDDASGDGELARAIIRLGREQQQQQNHHHQQQQGLHRLAVGWGWQPAAISAVLAGSPFLVSFTAGVGACVTDGVLLQLAASCPHLQSLALTLCAVSSSGVSAVLRQCSRLTSLQLQQCVGPFSVADMLPAQSGSNSSSPHRRWQLSTLQLSGGGRTACSDAELLELLGLTQGSVRSSSAAAATTGSSDVAAAAGGHVQLPQPSTPITPAAAHLSALCLVRVTGLTDYSLLQLAAAGCRLQHLRLEDCFCSSKRPSFSPSALLQLVGSTGCALSLRSLTLRHAVAPLPHDFVEALVHRAPLLQRLVLDACDLTGGFNLQDDAHRALDAVHVVRCRSVSGPNSFKEEADAQQQQLGDQRHLHHHHQHAEGSPGGSSGGRCVDKDLVVHLLHINRSIHLPPG